MSNYKICSTKEKGKVSKLIRYPDGVDRILSLKQSQWEIAEKGDKKGYPFDEVLDYAQRLAEDFPSENGKDADILKQTEIMLKYVSAGLHEEENPRCNDV